MKWIAFINFENSRLLLFDISYNIDGRAINFRNIDERGTVTGRIFGTISRLDGVGGSDYEDHKQYRIDAVSLENCTCVSRAGMKKF